MRIKTKLLYHGTTDRYHQMQVQDFGVYEHNQEGKRVDLDNYPETPMGYAVQRSGQYNKSNPILLVINASKVDSNLKWNPVISCDYLKPEWYKILNIKLENGKASIDSFKELKELEKLVLEIK